MIELLKYNTLVLVSGILEKNLSDQVNKRIMRRLNPELL